VIPIKRLHLATKIVQIFVLLVALLPLPVLAQTLTDSERAYLATHQPTVCVDPDWWPFEVIDESDHHVGIAADLHALVRQRLGLSVKLFVAHTWDEQLKTSMAGRCELLSFVNRTPERDKWLIFTEPLLSDPNVLITREEVPFISDLASLQGKTISLPRGTAMFERISKAYPNLRVIGTVTEDEAIGMVSNGKADMTLRSRIVAAYTIKNMGWFNLKINGQVPGYENHLRIGVLKSEPMLRDILDKGVAILTAQDRNKIIDRHVEIKQVTAVKTDYTLAKWLAALMAAIVLTSLFWLRHLRSANSRLQVAVAELQAQDAEQRQFIAMLSHEVRSPLAVIDTTAQLLAFQLDDDHTYHPLVERIRRGAARLANFFDNCLTHERVNSKNFALQANNLDVAELASWAKESAELLTDQHRIQLKLEAGLPPLHGDQTLLRIVLMNLLSNAIKYSPPNTQITLGFGRYQDPCRISVADQGMGNAADEQPLVFQRFQRGRGAQRTPGAGLGLTVAERIVALHGGRIAVTSHPGAGACFVVDLPFSGNAESKMQ